MESSNVFDALADEDDYGDDGEPTPPQPHPLSSPRSLAGSSLQRLTPNSRAILAARAARGRLSRQPLRGADPQPSYADVLNASLGAGEQPQQTRTTRPAPSMEHQSTTAQALPNATGRHDTRTPQGVGDLAHDGMTAADNYRYL